MRNLIAVAIVGGTSLLVAPHATATTAYLTFGGTVQDGYDLTGIFGTPGTSLTGKDYTATFKFDTAAAFTYRDDGGPSGRDRSAIANGPGLVSATLGIEGVEYTISGDLSSSINSNEGQTPFNSSFVVSTSDEGIFTGSRFTGGTQKWNSMNVAVSQNGSSIFPFPFGLEGDLTLTKSSSLILTSVLNVIERDYTAGLNPNYTYRVNTHARLAPNTMEFSLSDPTAAVAETPIPGALPLFASVLGLGGFFGYRRKRKAAMAMG